MFLRFGRGLTAFLRVLPVEPVLQAHAQHQPGLHPSPAAGITLQGTEQPANTGCSSFRQEGILLRRKA